MIIISRILLPKLGWQINVANHIKNQRRRSSRLATVMFHVLATLVFEEIDY